MCLFMGALEKRTMILFALPYLAYWNIACALEILTAKKEKKGKKEQCQIGCLCQPLKANVHLLI